MTTKEGSTETLSARRTKRFRAAVAKLSDTEVLRELANAQRETKLLRSGRELVAVADACRGAIDLGGQRIAVLQEQKNALQAQIGEIDQQVSIISDDRATLERELDRV